MRARAMRRAQHAQLLAALLLCAACTRCHGFGVVVHAGKDVVNVAIVDPVKGLIDLQKKAWSTEKKLMGAVCNHLSTIENVRRPYWS